MKISDTPPPADGNGAPPVPPQSAPTGERTFTQEEVNGIVERRLAEERRKKAPAPEAKQGDPPNGNDPQPDQLSKLTEQLGALTARLSKSEADTAFAEKVAGLPLTKEQRDILRGMPPESVDAAIQAFGLANKANQPNSPVPSYQSPGAPSGAPEEVMQSNAVTWTKDYIDQLRAEGKLLDEVEKWRRQMPGGGAGLFRRRIPKAS